MAIMPPLKATIIVRHYLVTPRVRPRYVPRRLRSWRGRCRECS